MIPIWEDVLLYRVLENQKVIMDALGKLTATALIHPRLKDAHDKTIRITDEMPREKLEI